MLLIENSPDIEKGSIFIMAFDGEKRSYYGLQKLVERSISYKKICIWLYNYEAFEKNKDLKDSIADIEYDIITIPNNQYEFIQMLKRIDFVTMKNNITIDISCLKTPHIFLTMKYLKTQVSSANIRVINTLPYDYIFNDVPFMSYKSYKGDLELCEILGYSGTSDLSNEKDLYVFIGFEGPMSLKVVEETVFKDLYLVNTMPSYYQKYKDVSVVNNYSLMASRNIKMIYAPARNPFEVYNILEKNINNSDGVCIAPLSTKPISLGICLYALVHSGVRVIYPISDLYNDIKSSDVYISYVYKFEL
jgi:hypothetical protein